jgi:hypothetical protein
MLDELDLQLPRSRDPAAADSRFLASADLAAVEVTGDPAVVVDGMERAHGQLAQLVSSPWRGHDR